VRQQAFYLLESGFHQPEPLPTLEEVLSGVR
jgi:hypothetical protein